MHGQQNIKTSGINLFEMDTSTCLCESLGSGKVGYFLTSLVEETC